MDDHDQAWDEADDEPGAGARRARQEARAPICPDCGVTAIPLPGAPGVDVPFVCDHDDCPAAGTVVG